VPTITVLQGKRIVLGITGSIAAFKAADLASKLTQAGAAVDVIMTEAAQRFVTTLTLQALTGRAVYTDMWQTTGGAPGPDGLPTHIAHVGLGEVADLLIIAPATANHIAKLAYGLADDLLTLTALNVRCPVLVAPAMDGDMYAHPTVAENLDRLRERGVVVIDADEGHMASGQTARGRLPEVPTLLGLVRQHLGRAQGALQGRRIVVTAGGTREALDPVRFLTNRSSGKQGYALAQAAIDAGATVTLITAATGLDVPIGAQIIPVESAQDMLDAVQATLEHTDALIMAAAVADFRPEQIATQKIKKTAHGIEIALTPTLDILLSAGLQREKTGYPHVLVGFAAETQDLLNNAQSKLERKHADFIIANDVSISGAGFQSDTNIVTVLGADGSREALPQQSKTAVAERIIERVAERLQANFPPESRSGDHKNTG
jgi:phosphopantothenoylcysteine decarboxylase / phosphopantothenate---cysteine ligase